MSGCSCSPKSIGDYVCSVMENLELTERIFWITVRCPELSSSFKPGNCVMVYPSPRLEPFLGRPFAVARANAEAGEISLCYMAHGRGTAIISHLAEGEKVRVRGFFGAPFETRGKKIHFAAGGVGAAVFFSMAATHPELTAGFYLGVPGAGCERYVSKVSELLPDVRIFSDDGTFGEGDSMFKALPEDPAADEEVWACGPPGFLAALERHYAKRLDRLFLALDRRMACGYGGCMGCVVRTKDGPKRICVDRSLFRADEVVKDER